MDNKNLPNLYDFLRALSEQAQRAVPGAAPISSGIYLVIGEAERDWLIQFLTEPDAELHFKAKKVGGTEEDPVVAQDYMIAGAEVDIFSLLTEAMMQNPTFAKLIQGAACFYQDHVPTCPDCQAKVLEAAQQPPSWEFSPHKLDEK
jgi:hypothetical protein